MHVSYRYHSLPWHRIQATSWQRKMLPLQNQFSKVRLLFFMPASFHLVNWYFNIFLCKGSFILSQLLELSTELCPLNYFTIIYLTGYWLTVHRAQPTELFSISLACPRRQKKMFSRWGVIVLYCSSHIRGFFLSTQLSIHFQQMSKVIAHVLPSFLYLDIFYVVLVLNMHKISATGH